MARPAPIFESPLVTWKPGNAAPDFGKISYRCQARWRSRPARQCVVWLATEVASHAFGGTARGELRHPTQATHDLGVAAVWLRLHQVAPKWASATKFISGNQESQIYSKGIENREAQYLP